MATEILRSSGRLRLRVTGWSMLPSVWPGDILEIQRISGQEISARDIVLFTRDRRLFAHRVVSAIQHRGGITILTEGDGMPQPDPVFSESELLGKVCSITRNGRSFEPNARLGMAQRGMAALVRRSATAARIITSMHSMLHTPEESVITCRN
jgi:hypothetical protein